jgi:hypothetical protein
MRVQPRFHRGLGPALVDLNAVRISPGRPEPVAERILSAGLAGRSAFGCSRSRQASAPADLRTPPSSASLPSPSSSVAWAVLIVPWWRRRESNPRACQLNQALTRETSASGVPQRLLPLIGSARFEQRPQHGRRRCLLVPIATKGLIGVRRRHRVARGIKRPPQIAPPPQPSMPLPRRPKM